jgi:hypothetical protein
MVVVGLESGGDPVIDLSFLSVDAVGVDLEQHGHVVAEPAGDLGGGDAGVEPERGRGVPQVLGPARQRRVDLILGER